MGHQLVKLQTGPVSSLLGGNAPEAADSYGGGSFDLVPSLHCVPGVVQSRLQFITISLCAGPLVPPEVLPSQTT